MSLESKKARDICEWTLDFDFERDRSNCLDFTLGLRQTDTHTDFFKNTFLECWSVIESKTIKKIEVDFFEDFNTFFTPNVARK